MKIILASILLFFAFESWSCGLLQTVAVKSTTGILDEGMASVFEESDLKLAEQAIASDLKLLEALHKSDPGNDHLLIMLAQGYAGYSLGFVEDQDPDRAECSTRGHATTGLRFCGRTRNSMPLLTKVLPRSQSIDSFSDDDVPALFWTANAWGNLINLSIGDPEALGDLYKVNAMMEFVLRRDENFFYGSAHLYFGTILATTPKMLGGDPEKAKEHFERCLAIGQGKLLLPYIYYAKSYAVQVQDKALFESLLKKVERSVD